MSINVLVLVVLAVVALWFVILPWLWERGPDPDISQDECHDRKGVHLTKEYNASESGVVRSIRLTDDGELVDRCELTDAIYEIRNCQQPELIVWYIHGWKHNAEPGDTDRKRFEEVIKQLAKQQPSERVPRRVVGIYVGWEGAVGPVGLRNLSFWNRKRAADRISQSAVLTKIFAATKNARRQREKVASSDLTIMIGHSFGARILYTATSQVLIDELQRKHSGEVYSSFGVVAGQADLILLLNPALEASVFTAMHSDREKSWEQLNPRQQPLLLAISTENDAATGFYFPLGQTLAFARRPRQRHTLGNYGGYVTHRLERLTSSDELAPSSRFWYDQFVAEGLLLQRTSDKQQGNPFIIARTTPDVIDGHNGIWKEDFTRWVSAFMLTLQERASAIKTVPEYSIRPLEAAHLADRAPDPGA